MLTETEFYFLRHGETDWNLRNLTQGQTDVPLNDTGRAQALAARELFGGLEIARICCSPLTRALDTAKVLQVRLGCALETIEDLAECSWGDSEGEELDSWFGDWKAGRFTPQGGEGYERFMERALRGVNQALERPGPVLIVAHKGVYWAVERAAALGDGNSLPNAIPIRHHPPRDGFPRWQTTVLAAS